MNSIAAHGAPDEQIVLVVPCYNEAERLKPADFIQALDRFPSLRLLLVDDGSKDATSKVLETVAAKSGGRATTLSLTVNKGKAEAVRQGLLRALEGKPSLVGYWDADLATPFDALPSFLDVFERHSRVEVVVGSRVKLLGRDIRRTAMRHYVGRVFATGASLVLGLPIYDTQCGAKIFRASDRVHQILRQPFATRWIFDVELLARYLDSHNGSGPPAHSKIYELPLDTWVDEPGSKVKAKDGVRAAADLLRVYWLRTR